MVDCGRPPFVFFSTSTTLATIVGTTITYNCFTGRRLVGDRQRTCQSNGQWSGDTPECVGKSAVTTEEAAIALEP